MGRRRRNQNATAPETLVAMQTHSRPCHGPCHVSECQIARRHAERNAHVDGDRRVHSLELARLLSVNQPLDVKNRTILTFLKSEPTGKTRGAMSAKLEENKG